MEVKPKRRGLEGKLEKLPFAGIILVILSAFFFSINTVLIKIIMQTHAFNPIQTVSASAAFLMIFYFFVLYLGEDSFSAAPGETFYLVARVITGAVAALTMYLSATLMPLGDSTAVVQSAPVYVTIISCLIFRVCCKVLHVVLLFVNLIGLCLISKPAFIFGKSPSSTNETDLPYLNVTTTNTTLDTTPSEASSDTKALGFAIACTSAILTGCQMVFLERLKKTSSSVSIFWHATALSITGYVVAIAQQNIRFPVASVIIHGIIFVCMVFGQHLQTIGFRLESAGLLAIIRTSQVFFGYVMQILILSEPLDLVKFGGALVIISTVVVIGLEKLFCSKKPKHKGTSDQSKGTDKNDKLEVPKSEPKATAEEVKIGSKVISSRSTVAALKSLNK